MNAVYVETTIPSYYTGRRARDIVLAARQELTIDWWDEHKVKYDLFTSQVVLDEIACGNEAFALKRTSLMHGIPLLEISENVIRTAELILESGIIPPKVVDDAYHVACASVHKIDFLLTWNCKHIANPQNRMRLRKLLARHDLILPIICTPEEMLADERYEDC